MRSGKTDIWNEGKIVMLEIGIKEPGLSFSDQGGSMTTESQESRSAPDGADLFVLWRNTIRVVDGVCLTKPMSSGKAY